MNEKIKELAKQAGFDSELMEQNHNKGNPSIAEQFAELIIQECITNIKDWELDSRNHISYMLKKHFGVE
jgi:hypothetical protein